MKFVKSISVGLFISLFVVSSSVSASTSVGDPGKAWEIPNDAQRGQQIFTILDNQFSEPNSYLIKSSFKPGVDTEDPSCSSALEGSCINTNYNFQAVLQLCESSKDTNCIVDFGIIDAQGNKSSAQFQNYFPNTPQNGFVGNPSKNIPSGGSGSVYKIPGASFDGGDNYYLAATLSGGGRANSPANIEGFSVYLFPVAQITSTGINKNGPNAGVAKITDAFAGHTLGSYVFEGPGLIPGTSCIVISSQDQTCLERYSFPADVRYFLKIRVKTAPAGWLHGRMSTPEITISKDNTNSLISISANPLSVPVVYKMYDWEKMPAELRANYDLQTGGYIPDRPIYVAGQGCGRSACDPDPAKRNVILAPSPYTKSATDQMLLWLPYLNDKAQAMYGNWSVRTLSSAETDGANKCFTNGDGVTGIVTTNSSTYSAGPPAYDKDTGSLVYKVAAPHFTTNGEVFKGSYDLVMRSDVARCVYGFSNAPVSATVSVLSSDGTTTVASTVVKESGGWMHLAANGFTFSSPTIQVKLSQVEPVVVKPEIKKTTISCVKGKTVKKVSAVNPKCPAGYKKK